MTKEELKEKLKSLIEKGKSDPEEAHVNADYALLDFIDDKEITEAFNLISKWYA